MKRGGLGGAILLAAAAAIAVLLLDRPAQPPRAPATAAPPGPAAGPEPSVPPEPPPVASAELPISDPAPTTGGGALSLVIRAGDGSVPEATVLIDPFYEEAGESRVLVATEGATIEGLAPEWNRVRVLAPGYAPVFLPVRLVPGGQVEATVALKPGATLAGTVRGPDGAPVDGAAVRSVAWGTARSATTDASGAYRIEHLPTGRVEMEAEGASGAARAFLDLEDEKEARWDPVLRPSGVISGRVVEDDGTPVAQARVTRSMWEEFTETAADADGAFRFDRCGDAVYLLSAWRPQAKRGPPAGEIPATPGDQVTITLRRGEGYARGTVVDRNGAAAAGATIRVWPAARPDREVRARAAADGSFRVGPLPPGQYLVEIHVDGEPTLHHRPAIEVVAGETVDLGVVRFPAGGRIRASVIDMAGGVLPDEEVEVLSLDGTITFAGERDGAVFLSEELTPGSYLVRAAARGLVEEMAVAAGGLVTAELRVRAGGKLTVLVTQADGQRVTATTRIEDAKGRVLSDYDHDPTAFLAEGEWRVIAVDERGRRAEAKIRMGREDQTMVLVLE